MQKLTTNQGLRFFGGLDSWVDCEEVLKISWKGQEFKLKFVWATWLEEDQNVMIFFAVLAKLGEFSFGLNGKFLDSLVQIVAGQLPPSSIWKKTVAKNSEFIVYRVSIVV